MNVAIKVEKTEVSYFNSLIREVFLFIKVNQVEILKILDGVPSVPKVIWSGLEKGQRIMI